MNAAEILAIAGAAATGLAGVLSAYASLVKAKHDADDECEGKLKELRAESEAAADELHKLRMRKAAGE